MTTTQNDRLLEMAQEANEDLKLALRLLNHQNRTIREVSEILRDGRHAAVARRALDLIESRNFMPDADV
jgi:hypothetical protein